MISYRVDYASNDYRNSDPVVIQSKTRKDAFTLARKMSSDTDIGVVFVIASVNGYDLGARIYENGVRSYDEGAFPPRDIDPRRDVT